MTGTATDPRSRSTKPVSVSVSERFDDDL
jgi:hypothetical protein